MREHRNLTVYMGKPARGDSDDLGIKRTFRWTVKEKGFKAVDWVHMPHDRDKWWAVCEQGYKPLFS
jgi:hypothetical protein